MIINAKDELVKFLGLGMEKCILCAKIDIHGNKIHLREYFTKEEYNRFLTELDITYDNGYGSQKLFGYIWLSNDMWLRRDEYDGAESWELMKMPKVPSDLKNIQREREIKLDNILKNDEEN